MAGPVRVSVVITVLDGERTIEAAVQSVLEQSLEALELIVIDDASSDRTPAILARCRDPRLRSVRQARNLGPFASANRGLELARGDYVARLDADDRCAPQRLLRQVAFLRAHPEVGIIGCSCRLLDARQRPLGMAAVYRDDLAIRWHALLRPPFVHSSVLWRRRLFERHALRYDPRLRVGGDYDLFVRALRHTRGANLASSLVSYSVRPAGITGSRVVEQRAVQDAISWRTIRETLPELTLQPRDLSELRLALIRSRHHPRARRWPRARRAQLAALYLQLFEAFCRRQVPRTRLGRLRQLVLRRARALAATEDGR